MEGLTPASADDLPPLGELLVDDPFWQYPAWGLAREGFGHLRVWATAAAGWLHPRNTRRRLANHGAQGSPSRMRRQACG
jgi:hypothetical protein